MSETMTAPASSPSSQTENRNGIADLCRRMFFLETVPSTKSLQEMGLGCIDRSN